MRPAIAPLLACFLILVPFFGASAQTNSQSKSPEKYPYLLYLPKDYESDKTDYPLVIYLHGGSQRGQDLNKLKTYGLPHLVEKGRDFTFIIASPNARTGNSGLRIIGLIAYTMT
ncbi:hypothetical protein [Spirosoma telluris]|uniref:hypothetical protein n=1 Tax=Spirosoma telluris TaxID=2183553 RepID=UPI002FC2C8B2